MNPVESSVHGLFNQLRDNIMGMDPVYFCERFLTIDGKPFDLSGAWKPFADIYRYVGLKAIEKDAKPIVLVKGRQVGATTMAAALECYFAACGIFGKNGHAPMRLMHLFPTLSLAAAYSKDKLDPMIGQSVSVAGAYKSNGLLKSYMENSMATGDPSNNNMHFKKFNFGNQVWIESTGLTGDRIRGRQLCLDTELPTPDRGFIKLRDLKQGDRLFDENGNVCNVTKLHPIQESPESYRVTFDDGTQIDACAEHLWGTQTRYERRKRKELGIRNTKEILETLNVSGESNHSIPLCGFVQYPKKDLDIDPYLLGLWLGDGDRYGRIETADIEVLSNYDYRLIESSVNHESYFGKSKSNSYRVIGLTTALTKLGLVYNPGKKLKAQGKGFYKKRIPREYLEASVEQRLDLLQGLMDADGCCNKDGRCEFVQCDDRKDLVDDVQELIHSLGIKTARYRKESWRYNVRYQDKHSIQFYTTLPVFKLNRKLQNLKVKLIKSNKRFIKSIELIEPKPMRCITVDSPSHLYLVTRSFIPTHNTVDGALFDEVQDMSDLAIGAVTKILAQSHYGASGEGMQVYFGTPKTKGGSYWEMWQNSSQNYFHLRCERCDKFFPLYHPDNNWEETWLYGYIVKCGECSHEQEKGQAQARGKWIPDKDPEFCDYVGYHINQLYIPKFTKETIEKAKPEKNPINTERIYMNEVLGEFYDGEGATITAEEIRENCAELDRHMVKRIDRGIERRVYGGFDWGQKGALEQMTGKRSKGGTSYSCAVILTAEANVFNIEFATRLMHADPEYKENHVNEMFRRYNMSLAIGDIGDAYDLTHRLQKSFDERFLASRASHRVTGHVKYSKDEWPKTVVFEKDYYISELLGLLKEGRIKFPYGSPDRIKWLVDHCASMDVKVTLDRAGDPIKRYVKGGGPNDGMMALLNAYLAWKFDVTQGFTIANPLHMKYEIAKEQAPVQAVLGHIPGMFGKGRGR